jgi:hypothetical protein
MKLIKRADRLICSVKGKKEGGKHQVPRKSFCFSLEVIKKISKPRLVAVLHRALGAGAVPSRLPGHKLQTALWHKLQIIDDKLQTALQYKLQIIDDRRAQQLHQAKPISTTS